MKKVLLFITVTVLVLSNVNAQKIKFGIKGGINFSEINSESINKTTGFNLGFISEIPISEKFYFQPELLYSDQGGSSINLNYLNLPLMGKYYLTKEFSIEAGPQVGYLLSAKTNSKNIKSSFNKFDFGANLGLGYKFNNGLNFGVRYNLGLTKINDINNAIEYSKIKSQNQVFQITVGYLFL
ncbi:MAG: porin family protein [Tenacibaculum sp.]